MNPFHLLRSRCERLGARQEATLEPATVLRISSRPDSGLVREYLSAHFAQERAGVLRELLVHLIAVLSGLVWVAAVWPRWLGAAATDSVLGSWVVFAVATLGAVLAEARWRRRCLCLRQKVDADLPGP